ncbi:MAG TPA: hypothetical protein VFJ10_06780, partial [Acidobacteriaceae bacterium]|nr:hypothetical protein [Acidobacteriaceae bacterium]
MQDEGLGRISNRLRWRIVARTADGARDSQIAVSHRIRHNTSYKWQQSAIPSSRNQHIGIRPC